MVQLNYVEVLNEVINCAQYQKEFKVIFTNRLLKSL